ncbi:hypothetical protein C2W64_00046 [Brevibacillus laterosporus]|nr:hypothetical protein C2W64_00046 [Brevibacillus laterosporus]
MSFEQNKQAGQQLLASTERLSMVHQKPGVKDNPGFLL